MKQITVLGGSGFIGSALADLLSKKGKIKVIIFDRKKAIESTQAEDDLEILRIFRNNLLVETDYMGNSDVTMPTKWKTYRQELRDITKKFKSMNDKDFKFPEKPKD